MSDPNLPLLISAATVLQPLLDDLVFVGGCMTGLLVNDPALSPIRATIDVDAVVEVSSYAEYSELSERLKQLGLTPDSSEGAPPCRWKHGDTRIDLMPIDAGVLGFSNRWYGAAVRTAMEIQLTDKLRVRTINAPYFIATKLEAFRNRGRGSYLGSHDLEDIISLIDGRDEIVTEIQNTEAEVGNFIRDEFGKIVSDRDFFHALPGFLAPDEASQQRIEIVLARLNDIVAS